MLGGKNLSIENFEKPENEEQKEARPTAFVSDHWFIYIDDPFKLLFTNGKGQTTWIRFCSNDDAKRIFSEVEEKRLKDLRKYYKDGAITKEQASAILEIVPELKEYVTPEDLEALEAVNPANSTPPATTNPPAKTAGETKPGTWEDTNKTFTTQKGSELVIAQKLGLDAELADAFFMKLNGNFYIKVAGLQFMAGKIGYQNIEVTDHFDEKSKSWIAEAKIFPKISPRSIEAIAKLIPELQKEAFDAIRSPTNGIGTASDKNVTNSRMLPFLREMAQTRAIGRALRSYTGYGSTSYEEMPEAELQKE